MLLDSGKPAESIAEYLFLSCNSIANHLKRYQEGGIEEFVSDDYQGKEFRLNETQRQELALHLEENLYQTVAAIRDHIQVTYKIKYSLSGVRHYEKFADFRSAILHFFKNITRYRTELSSLMTLNFHLLGA